MRNISCKRLLTAMLAALFVLLCPLTVLAQEGEASPSPEADGGQPYVEAVSEGQESSAGEEPAQPDEEPEEAPEASQAQNSALALGGVYQASGQVLRMGTHEAYMPGVRGDRFFPNQVMTRAEIAQTLYNLLKDKPENPSCQYSDVDEGHAYYAPIAALAELNLMTGGGDGRFNPEGRLSRAEFAVILGRCFETEEGEINYSDVGEDHWAYEAIASATAKEWMSGPGDGSFRPTREITRIEVAKVLNVALGRTGEGFAADRDVQEFQDVPMDHWGFLHAAEAADPEEEPDPTPEPDPDPTPAPTPEPTPAPSPSGDPNVPSGFKVGGQVRVTSDNGLNVRSGPGTGFSIVTAAAYRAVMTITDVSSYPWVGVKTSGGQSGYSLADFLEPYTPGSDPTPPPVQNGTLTATSLTIPQYMSARLDAQAGSSISGAQWTSSNPDVAYVGYTVDFSSKKQCAAVYAKAPGTATLTFGAGGSKATCTVTVTAPQAVRFAYGDGNSVGVNVDFDLVAITDESRDEVRFEIVDGPASGSYACSSYQTETRTSEFGLPDNRTRVFRRKVSFGAVGLYTIRAYSNSGEGYSTDYYTFTVQVTSNDDMLATTDDTRQISGLMLRNISSFEGYVPEIEDDRLVNGNPTVGYGYVVSVNDNFYNNMTRTEAYACLINLVNQRGFGKTVDSFRRTYNIKMSQGNFDAMASMVYNLGVNSIFNTNEYETPYVILNMVVPPTDASSSNPYAGIMNVKDTDVYSQPDYTSQVTAKDVPQGTNVSVVDVYTNISRTRRDVWYRVVYTGGSGWVPSGYIKLNGDFVRDLYYADTTSLANEFLQWHMAGGHVEGLVWRRLSECKTFFFSDYDDYNCSECPNYTINKYGFRFPACEADLDRR